MKRLSIFLLVLTSLFFVSIAFADDIDLSGMSYEELISLQEKVNEAIYNSNGWSEIVLPKGHYKVGKEIPSDISLLLKSTTGDCFILIYDSNNVPLGTDVIEKGEEIKLPLLEVGNYIVIDSECILKHFTLFHK